MILSVQFHNLFHDNFDSFHLSFTVLVHYRLLNILDFEGGPPIKIQTKNTYSILLLKLNNYQQLLNTLQGFYLFCLPFQYNYIFKNYNYLINLILFRSPLLKNSWLIYPIVTKMFQFTIFLILLNNFIIVIFEFSPEKPIDQYLQLPYSFRFLNVSYSISRYPLNTFIDYFKIKKN